MSTTKFSITPPSSPLLHVVRLDISPQETLGALEVDDELSETTAFPKDRTQTRFTEKLTDDG